MKIRLHNLSASPRGVFPAGSVVDLPAEEAVAMVRGGYATAVDPPEAAVVTPPEAAVAPPAAEIAAVKPPEQAAVPAPRPSAAKPAKPRKP